MMELKVWVEGLQRVVCGVGPDTTCHDVVMALAQATGRTGRFTLSERWRGGERVLAYKDKPFNLLRGRGELAAEVQFVLSVAPLDSNKPKKEKRPPTATSQQSRHNGDNPKFSSHNFTPPELPSCPPVSQPRIKKSISFSGAHNQTTPLKPGQRRLNGDSRGLNDDRVNGNSGRLNGDPSGLNGDPRKLNGTDSKQHHQPRNGLTNGYGRALGLSSIAEDGSGSMLSVDISHSHSPASQGGVSPAQHPPVVVNGHAHSPASSGASHSGSDRSSPRRHHQHHGHPPPHSSSSSSQPHHHPSSSSSQPHHHPSSSPSHPNHHPSSSPSRTHHHPSSSPSRQHHPHPPSSGRSPRRWQQPHSSLEEYDLDQNFESEDSAASGASQASSRAGVSVKAHYSDLLTLVRRQQERLEMQQGSLAAMEQDLGHYEQQQAAREAQMHEVEGEKERLREVEAAMEDELEGEGEEKLLERLEVERQHAASLEAHLGLLRSKLSRCEVELGRRSKEQATLQQTVAQEQEQSRRHREAEAKVLQQIAELQKKLDSTSTQTEKKQTELEDVYGELGAVERELQDKQTRLRQLNVEALDETPALGLGGEGGAAQLSPITVTPSGSGEFSRHPGSSRQLGSPRRLITAPDTQTDPVGQWV